MQSQNIFYITGNIGSVTLVGKSLKISIATSRFKKDTDGQTHGKTDWVQITVLQETLMTYLNNNAQKGDVIQAEGRITNNHFIRNGETVYTTNLIAQRVNLFRPKAPKLDS